MQSSFFEEQGSKEEQGFLWSLRVLQVRDFSFAGLELFSVYYEPRVLPVLEILPVFLAALVPRFFDILTPPYNPRGGRDCTYFDSQKTEQGP